MRRILPLLVTVLTLLPTTVGARTTLDPYTIEVLFGIAPVTRPVDHNTLTRLLDQPPSIVPRELRQRIEELLSQATERGSDDHGDARRSATRWSGRPISGAITVGDEDWFLLRITTPVRLLIATEGTLDTVCTLLDRAGEVVEEDDDSGGEQNCSLLTPRRPGLYYVRLKGSTQEAEGSYTLSAKRWVEEAETDSPTTATWLVLDRKRDESLSAIDREDWYRFRLGSSVRLAISTEGEGDLSCALFPERSQTPLLEDDDTGKGVNCLLLTGVLGRGIYRLRVTSVNPLTVPLPYAVGVTTFASDGNDESYAAPLIPVPSSLDATFTTTDLHDWYRFALNVPQTILLRTQGSTDTVCRLYRAGGDLISEDDDSGGEGNCQITQALSAGIYLLDVAPFSLEDAGNEPYRLEVFRLSGQ